MYIAIYLLLGVLVITAVLMVLIVLMQRPKNEGLGAAFGGGMTQDLFGAQTTNVLQKFTVYLGAVFFAVCLLLTILYSKTSTQTSDVQKKLAASAAAAKTKVAPSPTPSLPATGQTPGDTKALPDDSVPSMDAVPPVVVPSVDAAPAIPTATTESQPDVVFPEVTPEAVATP